MKTLISTFILFMLCLIVKAGVTVLIPEINYKIDLPENWRVEKVNENKAKIVYSIDPYVYFLINWEKTKNTKSDSSPNYTTSTENSSTTTSQSRSISNSTGVKTKKSNSTKDSFKYYKSFLKKGYTIIINCDIDNIDNQTKKELNFLIKKFENY